ncbi:MAG: Hsp20/alpha crystallin family protein [Alphaproteobacteria bacterium]|nr:Hsp20/alpha crystallin family protein [Alphaproteobacteria bacterium]
MTKLSLMPRVFGSNSEPFREFSRDLEKLEKSFNDFWRGAPLMSWTKEGGLLPNVDIIEHDKEIQIIADLPGLKEEDINIEINNGILTLRGEKKEEKEEKRSNYYLSERSSTSFNRTFQLPTAVDENNVNASLEDGVLKIILPKSTEKDKQIKRIEIKRK